MFLLLNKYLPLIIIGITKDARFFLTSSLKTIIK
nr:MAG TPA: hypothetical protein [Caudoviricetes sp.]